MVKVTGDAGAAFADGIPPIENSTDKIMVNVTRIIKAF
jgi:hypothetical protein